MMIGRLPVVVGDSALVESGLLRSCPSIPRDTAPKAALARKSRREKAIPVLHDSPKSARNRKAYHGDSGTWFRAGKRRVTQFEEAPRTAAICQQKSVKGGGGLQACIRVGVWRWASAPHLAALLQRCRAALRRKVPI